ncbi:MAG TPA: hypothetical protein VK008_07815 [Sphingobacteriaceae bacterium]|nr:hypothetical protein [Sphingobacteriaceae bacterium]
MSQEQGAGATDPRLEEAIRKADSALILLEGLVNYLRAINIVDVDDFNDFLQEHEVTSGPMFQNRPRPSDIMGPQGGQ